MANTEPRHFYLYSVLNCIVFSRYNLKIEPVFTYRYTLSKTIRKKVNDASTLPEGFTENMVT